MTTNPYFLNYEISHEIVRTKLPAMKDPKEKINILSVLKDAIGKDLTRFAVPGKISPLYLNMRVLSLFLIRRELNIFAKH